MDHKIYLKMRREQLFYKDEQIHKMTTIFTQNDNFWLLLAPVLYTVAL